MIPRYIIYITNDKNQFAGIDYYIDEKNLDYTLVLVKTVNEALLLPFEVKSCILGVLLDWELSGEGLQKEDAVIHLEKEFPLVPVIVIYGREFGEVCTVSYYQNKQVSHPSDLVEIINNFVSFYQCDWITSDIKHLTYEIEYFGNDKSSKGKMSAYFNDDNPIKARANAISFFKMDRYLRLSIPKPRVFGAERSALPNLQAQLAWPERWGHNSRFRSTTIDFLFA